MNSHTNVISTRTFGEMSREEQKAYWADAAEYCRDIVRTEHADMSAERLERTLKTIARNAAQAEDPICLRHVDALSTLVVPTVDDVLAAPVRPCSFRITKVPLPQ